MKSPEFVFKHKRVTILGGTGTLGQALTAKIQELWPDMQITIVSRGEHKQAEMAKRFPKCVYMIGDISKPNQIKRYFQGRDIVFHTAALKHVDVAQRNPLPSWETNIVGTHHAAELAFLANVPRFVFSSTDKAVDPITQYGYHKASAEDYLFNFNRLQSTTRFSVYRWGNVLGSQGSVIPYFAETLLRERKAYITHPDMTRFWIPIEWAVNFMLFTFNDAYLDKAMVPPTMKSASVRDVIDAVAEIVGVRTYSTITTGLREKEKIHEAIFSQHSSTPLTSETCQRYSKSELIELIAPIIQPQAKAAA